MHSRDDYLLEEIRSSRYQDSGPAFNTLLTRVANLEARVLQLSAQNLQVKATASLALQRANHVGDRLDVMEVDEVETNPENYRSYGPASPVSQGGEVEDVPHTLVPIVDLMESREESPEVQEMVQIGDRLVPLGETSSVFQELWRWRTETLVRSVASRRIATPHPVDRIDLTRGSEEVVYFDPMPGVLVLEVIGDPVVPVQRMERVQVAPVDELVDYQDEVERQRGEEYQEANALADRMIAEGLRLPEYRDPPPEDFPPSIDAPHYEAPDGWVVE